METETASTHGQRTRERQGDATLEERESEPRPEELGPEEVFGDEEDERRVLVGVEEWDGIGSVEVVGAGESRVAGGVRVWERSFSTRCEFPSFNFRFSGFLP